MELREYQREITQAIHNTQNTVLLTMPTGTGKTVVFMNYAIKNNFRTLVLNWSEELIEQVIETAKMIDPKVSIGKFIGSERDFDSQIVVASVQTLKNINNLTMIDRNFDLIIMDEAHHATSQTSKKILYAFGMVDLDTAGIENTIFTEPHFYPTRKLLGVTATPERTDKVLLGQVFSERIDAPDLEWFIDKGHLCDLKIVAIETGIDMSDVRSYAGDLSESGIAKKLIESGYMNELSRVVGEHFSECESIIIYVPNVKTAKMAAKLINDAGIPSDYVVGSERDRRKQVIQNFKDKKIRVLVNCLVLKEGFDAPNTDGIILCRPTKSKLLLRQIIGRGTRNAPGKQVCKIGDLVVGRRQQDLISASGVFSSSELIPYEYEQVSIKEKIQFQRERASELPRLLSVLEQIRDKRTSENEKKRRRANADKDTYKVKQMSDNVSLLIDTRILKKVGFTANEFYQHFSKERQKLEKANPFTKNKENLFDYQIKYLVSQGYDREDLEILNPLEAQSFLNVIKRQSKPVSPSTVSVLSNVYKVPRDKIPNKDVEARLMVKKLASQKVRHGKA